MIVALSSRLAVSSFADARSATTEPSPRGADAEIRERLPRRDRVERVDRGRSGRWGSRDRRAVGGRAGREVHGENAEGGVLGGGGGGEREAGFVGVAGEAPGGTRAVAQDAETERLDLGGGELGVEMHEHRKHEQIVARGVRGADAGGREEGEAVGHSADLRNAAPLEIERDLGRGIDLQALGVDARQRDSFARAAAPEGLFPRDHGARRPRSEPHERPAETPIDRALRSVQVVRGIERREHRLRIGLRSVRPGENDLSPDADGIDVSRHPDPGGDDGRGAGGASVGVERLPGDRAALGPVVPCARDEGDPEALGGRDHLPAAYPARDPRGHPPHRAVGPERGGEQVRAPAVRLLDPESGGASRRGDDVDPNDVVARVCELDGLTERVPVVGNPGHTERFSSVREIGPRRDERRLRPTRRANHQHRRVAPDGGDDARVATAAPARRERNADHAPRPLRDADVGSHHHVAAAREKGPDAPVGHAGDRVRVDAWRGGVLEHGERAHRERGRRGERGNADVLRQGSRAAATAGAEESERERR